MAGRRSSPARHSALAQILLFMASTASAALTLSDFQSITSSSVPLGCILAYNNNPLSGCSQQTDFTAGNGCSASCARSLRLIQTTLQTVCGDASSADGSVLGAAMQGTLVETLCGRGMDQQSSSSTTATRTSQPVASQPTSASQQQSPNPTRAGPSATSSSAVEPTDTLPTETPSPQAPADDQRGGGSPFDAVIMGAAAKPAAPSFPMLLLTTLVGVFLVWGSSP